MVDNAGSYVSLGQMLTAFADGGLAVSEKVMLTAKTGTVAPAGTFNVAGSTLTPAGPQVFDWIVQGPYAQQVLSVTTTVATLADVTNLVNGEARLVRTSLMASEIQAFGLEAMAFIDRHTRQWFNARALTMRVVGNNSPLFQFQVPIISISAIYLNGDTAVFPVTNYMAPVSRVAPDDRRNPRILITRGDIDIYQCAPRIWRDDKESVIEGVFGFLEADGSTPLLIQRATAKLAVMRALSPAGKAAIDAAGSSTIGPLKREKTDKHEVEYFNPSDTAKGSNLRAGTGLSGDDEIDDVIASYRSPILIGGSILEVTPRYTSEVTTWW